LKLLIAEDDLTSRTMLAAVAHKWGYEPIVVEDGEAAWQVIQGNEPPRLMLLDWEMPLLDGLALCQRIREQQLSDDPPFIILLTARSDTADIVEGLGKGANDYIAKPFENSELQARLQVGRRMLDLQTELAQAREALTFQASHDVLTGLMNRRAVMNTLEKEIARAHRQGHALAIGLCDIDHFKQINDSYGHLAGDAVLKEVAQRMETALRPYDHIGRYGGEEFLVVLSTDSDQALNPFERICRAIADKPFVIDQEMLKVTISCGVTLVTSAADKRDGTTLLSAADTALYEAKATGRNRTLLCTQRQWTEQVEASTHP
jgi:diguanylate cyclase (GGDEF)-like protein